MGKWADGAKKPYTDKKENVSEADRLVAPQPLLFKEEVDERSKVIFNLRQMNELPYHLTLAVQLDDLKKNVLCNFLWLYQKIRATGVDR